MGSRGVEREEKGQLLGFAGPFKECELYSRSDGEPLRGLKSGQGIIRCTGLKGYVSCRAENGLNGEKNPDGCPSPAPTSALVPPAIRGPPRQRRHYLLSTRPYPSSRPRAPNVPWPPESTQTPEAEVLLADPG